MGLGVILGVILAVVLGIAVLWLTVLKPATSANGGATGNVPSITNGTDVTIQTPDIKVPDNINITTTKPPQ